MTGRDRIRRRQLLQLEHRAHERQGRLRPLVAVHPIWLQTVEAAAGRGIEDRHRQVVVSEEPRTRVARRFCPPAISRVGEGSRACFRHRPRLDRLLVERRLLPIPAAATDRREAEVTVDHLLANEPPQQV